MVNPTGVTSVSGSGLSTPHLAPGKHPITDILGTRAHHTHDRMGRMAPQKPKRPVIIGVAVAAALLLTLAAVMSSKDSADTTSPTPKVTTSPVTSKAPRTKSGPTPEQVITHVAQATGQPTLDDACIGGISWACNVEAVTPRGSTLEVRVRALETDGDRAARAWFNFTTAGDNSPMPELSYVQITTAQGGAVGSYRKPL